MSKSLLALPLSAIIVVGVAGLMARAADPVGPASPVPAAAPATAPAAVPATGPSAAPRADAPAAPGVELGRPFVSLSAGISFSPPLGLKPLREVDKDEIVQFRTPEPKTPDKPGEVNQKLNPNTLNLPLPAAQPAVPIWSLSVSRKTFPQPMDLTTATDTAGRERPGLIENTVAALKQEHYQSFQLLRQDLTNLGNYDVGVIIYRYSRNADRFLAQRAIIQANDQLYYLIALTTPAPRVDNPTRPDPDERLAVDTFRAVLDSVKLLDRKPIRDDQVARLVRTRSLLFNFTERKLTSTLIDKQWRRILKHNRDVGYQYIVEGTDVRAGSSGIRVGIRTRVMTNVDKEGRVQPYPREDSESWMFTTMDRKHEDWSKQTVIDDGQAKTPSRPWQKLTEFGTSDLKSSRFLVADPKDVANPRNQFLKGEIGDPNQPWMGVKDSYALHVQYSGSKGDLDPVDRPLPPYYLPQAFEMMLPRLLPPNEAKSYLVATYVSDAREVMMRYLEVGPEQQVTLAGRPMRAVPIKDHLTLEGTVTTHYVDSRGNWLGSETRETGITILPTDERTLVALWKEPDLFKLDDAAGAPTAGDPATERVLPRGKPGPAPADSAPAATPGRLGR